MPVGRPGLSMSQTPAPRLPAEVVAKIIDWSACSEPAPSKHHLALALTSRAVHAFSERGRWRSIAIRSHAQLLNFADLLDCDEAALRQQAESFGLYEWEWKGSRKQRSWMPTPKRLCSYLTNLLIEIGDPVRQFGRLREGTREEVAFRSLQDIFVGLLHRVTHWSANLQVMSLSSVVTSGLADIVCNQKRFGRAKHHLFSNDRVFAQLPTEEKPLFGPFGPQELTLEWDGSDSNLRSILYSDCWCPTSDALPSSASFAPDLSEARPPVYVGLASRIRRLHLIGYDPENPHDGFTIPVQILMDTVIAGSLRATYNLVQARARASAMWRAEVRKNAIKDAPAEASAEALFASALGAYTAADYPLALPMVTHLRFDTPKFTMRPFEALAQRLLPLFEHLHVVGAPYPAPAVPTSTKFSSGRPRARHPYHDEDVQASITNGSYRIPVDEIAQARPSSLASDPTNTIEAADFHLRAAFGAASFSRLHLTWDSPPVAADEKVSTLTSRLQAVSASDWPAERRDVWTNHSTPAHRASGRAPPDTAPGRKAANTQRGPSDASSSFTMELAEAVEHRIQYPFTQRLFEAQGRRTYPRRALIQNRTDEELQRLRSADPLWMSDTEHQTNYLCRELGRELLMRGCAPSQLAAAREAADRLVRLPGRAAAAAAAAAAVGIAPPGTLQTRTMLADGRLEPPLPVGALTTQESGAVLPTFLPELELVPTSPYAPSPASPAVDNVNQPRPAPSAYGRPAQQRKADPILKLGCAFAAFTPEERVRLFVERIHGGSGSWI
ncbi:hypothetical protein OC842_004150 [Tilletia horrida]|uniref:Uncharacterized protein n=1 Tax=Tilletia horrida TaxID=155126 RepID=A0AAN6JJU1_9BASI|nr:hypothetical protein OC842_004150 [Tilletia horrida]